MALDDDGDDETSLEVRWNIAFKLDLCRLEQKFGSGEFKSRFRVFGSVNSTSLRPATYFISLKSTIKLNTQRKIKNSFLKSDSGRARQL